VELAKRAGWLVSVRGLLRFSRCELRPGTVREPTGRGTSAVGSRYGATASEDTAGREDLSVRGSEV
jgi:hypothetical protein